MHKARYIYSFLNKLITTHAVAMACIIKKKLQTNLIPKDNVESPPKPTPIQAAPILDKILSQ